MLHDIRYALRGMRNNKLFTAMAVLSLALGIGANTSIYSFMEAILMRSLPVGHPRELVVFNWRAKAFPPLAHSFSGNNHKEPDTGMTSNTLPYPAMELLRAGGVCSSVFAFTNAGRLNVMVNGRAELGSDLVLLLTIQQGGGELSHDGLLSESSRGGERGKYRAASASGGERWT